jgi:hypothetical protein
MAVVVAVIVGSTLFLALLLAPSGLETRWKDQRHYLASAWSLAHGGGLRMPELDPMSWRVEQRPLASFPPLLPLALATALAAGVPEDAAPTAVSLFAWPFLLAGIGLLALRLGASPSAAAAVLTLAAVTWPFLHVFTRLQSESLFLPLLAWTVVAFHRLPWAERRAALHFGAALLLLALLLLSRYTGMFVFLPIVGWWVVTRAGQRRWRQLAVELAGFAIAALPLLLWLLRNQRSTGGLFGPTLLSETLDRGAAHVLASFLTHATWLPLPALRPGPLWRHTPGWALVYGLVLASGVALLWHARRGGYPGRHAASTVRRWSPETPIVPILVFYLGFLLFAPLFMRMQGMIERYMAVVLCLALPWIAAFVSRRAGGVGVAWLVIFTASNLLLVAGATLAAAPASDWWRTGAPVDFADRPVEAERRLHAGAPAWLVHRPPRIGDLRRHLPEVAFLVDERPARAVISNAPDLFTRRPLLPSENGVELWLERGSCSPPEPTAVVVVDWDRWRRGVTPGKTDPAELLRRVGARCPHLATHATRHATVWLLPEGPE